MKSAPGGSSQQQLPCPWEWLELPWCHLHAYGGPFVGKIFLLLMDAHSKWLEASTYGGISYLCSNHTKDESIFLQVMVHLYPWTLVTDNGSLVSSPAMSL